MKFYLNAPSPRRSYKDAVLLYNVAWNDWFEFATLYVVYYSDEEGEVSLLGSVKIGQEGLIGSSTKTANSRTPNIPPEFDVMPSNMFSLGQDDEYYSNLNKLGDFKRKSILSGLNDIAFNSDIYEKAIKERVTRVSLLRSVSPISVQGHFRRLAMGDSILSSYHFSYTSCKNARGENFTMEFSVEPLSNPPTNVHVVIGRNGAGKTHLLNNMVNSLVRSSSKLSRFGYFESDGDSDKIFSNIVSITFSAFDDSEIIPERRDSTLGVKYSYIGLKRNPKPTNELLPPKSPTMLSNEFRRSLELCIRNSIIERWVDAIRMLDSDLIFSESAVADLALLDPDNKEVFKSACADIFNNLSSGHKIVLLTITKLVEKLEEKSLVILDEPEAHLHPPLLSAFIRVLSDLLIKKNAVSIIATHSPVVLQEVPKSCVWLLRRNGANSNVRKLSLESFGENVGILTREVFGLEVTYSGYHRLLTEAIQKHDTFEDVVGAFNNEIGGEGQAIVRTLMLKKQEI